MFVLDNDKDVAKISRWREEQQLFYDAPHLRLSQVALLVRELMPTNMVDLGCARGYLRKLCGGVPYTGCDFVDLDSDRDFPFFRCDFNHESLPDQITEVDLIVCSGLLEYIVDVQHFIGQCESRLSPGGHLIATYINKNHISRKVCILAGRLPYHHPDWQKIHSTRDLSRMIAVSGLKMSATYAMDCSIRSVVSARDSARKQVPLSEAGRWSYWLSHHIIYVAQKAT